MTELPGDSDPSPGLSETSGSLITKLVLARFLTTEARVILADSGPFSAGRAASTLQDGIELFFRAMAAEKHVQLKEKSSFDELIQKVAEAISPISIPFRTSLNELNRIRVDFKHFALQPDHEVVLRLAGECEVLLEQVTRTALRLSPEEVSLAALVGHGRTEHWLRTAERYLDEGDYRRSIEASAAAATIYYNLIEDRDQPERLSYKLSGAQRGEMSSFADEIEERLREVHSHLSLLKHGVDLSRSRKFVRIVPHTSMAESGRLFWNWDRDWDACTREEAEFAYRFARDSALAMKRNRLPEKFPRKYKPDGQLRVVEEAVLVFDPEEENERLEVIRRLKVGELLDGFRQAQARAGHLPVLVQEEVLYVSEDAVEWVPEPGIGERRVVDR